MRDVIPCLRGTDFCPSCPLRGTIWGQNYEKNMKTGRKYGEKEKIQILIKPLIFRTLRIYIFSFYAFLFFVSLADAKIPKYIAEGFVGADFADDFAEVIEGFAEVLGYQVRREGGDMEAGADTLKS